MLRVPPPLWVLALLTTLYLLSELPIFANFPIWRHEPAGVMAMLAGFAITFGSITHFLAVGTQVLPTSETNDKLVTSGTFALSRNPMYLGLVLVSLGVAFWFGRPLMFLAPILFFAVANWLFIPYEEAKMRSQYGEAFDAYAKKVRRWL